MTEMDRMKYWYKIKHDHVLCDDCALIGVCSSDHKFRDEYHGCFEKRIDNIAEKNNERTGPGLFV